MKTMFAQYKTFLSTALLAAVLVTGGWLSTIASAQEGNGEVPSPSPSNHVVPAETPVPETSTPEASVSKSPVAAAPAVICRPAAVRCCRPCCRPCRQRCPIRSRLFRRLCECRNGNLSTQTAAPEVATEAKPDPYAWKPLFNGKDLKGWKIPEFGGEGEVDVDDGAIVLSMGDMMTGITYTGEVPRDNYEIELEGKRVDGVDFFATTTFPVGKDSCTFVVGGWGGTVVGLSNVDYYDASDNFTTTFKDFKKGQWYKIRIRVTPERIQAWIDDEKTVDQEREGHKFSIRFEVDLCQPLGISSWCTTGAVRNIRLRNLPPAEAGTATAEPETAKTAS